MSELLTCPFCGGEAEAVHEINGFWTVECIECGALVDGIEAWNSRVERTCMVISSEAVKTGYQYKCEECCELFSTCYDIPNYCPNCGAKVVRND